MNELFQDIKVIELASVLAGPAVGMFFAELGAEVAKIENKRTAGDVTRTWRLPTEAADAPVSAYYCAINWNKSVELLDLSQADDRAKVHALVKEADIVIANYKKSSAQKLQMDYDYLKTLNPTLIYGNISGFGEDSSRVAFDVVLQAESGFMYMNGQPDSLPTKMPVALIDVLAAHQLKEGLLVALLNRYKTGKGAYVSVSLLEAAVASLANQATNWLMGGHIPQRMGSLHPNIAPYGELFQTKDKQLVILSIGSNKQFEGLCHCLERLDLLEALSYKTNALRVKNRVALAEILELCFAEMDAATILERCHKNFVPIGLVRDMKAVFEQDTAAAMILEEEINGLRTQRVRTAAFKLDMQQ